MTIREFIIKWQPILTHWNGVAEDHQFAEDCWACGFEMDRGESFVIAFPGKHFLTHADELLEVIDSVNSSKLLGSAIFSYWRLLTHSWDGPLPDDAENWFAIAFGRLLELSEEGK